MPETEEEKTAAKAQRDAEIAAATAEASGAATAASRIVTDAQVDADAAFAQKLDDVENHEDHRQKGGRSIKFSD